MTGGPGVHQQSGRGWVLSLRPARLGSDSNRLSHCAAVRAAARELSRSSSHLLGFVCAQHVGADPRGTARRRAVIIRTRAAAEPTLVQSSGQPRLRLLAVGAKPSGQVELSLKFNGLSPRSVLGPRGISCSASGPPRTVLAGLPISQDF